MVQSNSKNTVHLECLKTNDLRLLNFYLRALAAGYTNIPRNGRGYTAPPYPSVFFDEHSHLRKIIKDALALFNDFELKEIDYDLTVFGQQNIIPLEQFNWLKEDLSACMYLWMDIANRRQHFDLEWRNGHLQYTYASPSSHSERYQNIIDYFDYSFLQGRKYQKKIELLDSLKTQWMNVKKNTPSLAWLTHNSNEETTTWAWDYIEKYNEDYAQSSFSSTYFTIPIPPVTINDQDQKYAIIAALQHWRQAPDTKTLFYQRMSRAWSQRKTRKTREDMKAINTYISVQHKDMLDKLAKYNRFRMNEMLEFLIEDAYEQERKNIEAKYGQ